MSPALIPAHGRWLDTGATDQPPAWFAAARAAGFVGVVLDLMTPGWETAYARAGAAGLARMLFQGYYPPAFADPAQAVARAQLAVAAAQRVGYRGTVWLDWEAVPGTVSGAAAERWINAWAQTVDHALGRGTAGLYEGANQPLDGPALYYGLIVVHYWKSASLVPAVVARGYQGVQLQASWAWDGHAADQDLFQADALGDTAWAEPGDAAAAAPSAPGGGDLAEQVAALAQAVAALKAGAVTRADLAAWLATGVQRWDGSGNGGGGAAG